MTTPNGEGPKDLRNTEPKDLRNTELADMPHLSDLQATDALLDRLAARTPTDDDLRDPLIAELARFAEFADANPVPAPGIERLIEVLDGRPLYMFDRGTAAATEADEPIQLDDTRPIARTIDLRDPAGQIGATDDADDADSGIAARATGTDDVVPANRLTQLRAWRAAKAEHRDGWQGVVQQLALPAASVVALLALGGGVSAVVTGDPMAPVDGVTRVLTGNSDSDHIKSANTDLDLAQAAVVRNDVPKASQYLQSAKNKLDDVSDASKQAIAGKVDKVDAIVSAAAGSIPASSVVPSVQATSTPSVTPSPSTPVVTVPPSSDPTTTTPSASPSDTMSIASDQSASGGGSTTGTGG